MPDVSIPGLFWRPVRMAAIWTVFLVSLLVASWTINWFTFFVFTDGGKEGLFKLQDAVMAEVDRLAERQPRLRAVAVEAANGLYGVIFGETGVSEMGKTYARPSRESVPDTIVRRAYVANWAFIQSAMISTRILALRLVCFASAVPLVVLAYAAGMIDGLVGRAVRRVRGGRESSNIYHRAKYLAWVLACSGIVILSLWPGVPKTDTAALVFAVATALGASWQWRFYKKHL